ALFDTNTNTWSAGPQIPVKGAGADDAAGAVTPDGHFIFAADTALPGTTTTTDSMGNTITTPNYFTPPTNLFDFNPNTHKITQLSTDRGLDAVLARASSYVTRMLVLPSGQVLLSPDSFNSNQLWLYKPDGLPDPSWWPTVAKITDAGNGTFTLSGTQLN